LKGVPVLFENEDCIILTKPAGLPVQGGKGVGVSLDELLAAQWSPRPHLVHRLDKDTSGLILTAKTREAAAKFATLFAGATGENRGVRKLYLAVCVGKPKAGSGEITESLTYKDRKREARTRYRRLGGDGEYSLLELEPGTGRMHQIRRHLAQIGNPVLGDDKYGDFSLNRDLRKTRGLRRLLLHSARLILSLPGLSLDISAPLPDYFRPFLDGFPDIPGY
jgi:23S rRNA pseudouridine955/2504/2580 synthase